jgi:hypothetical protein
MFNLRIILFLGVFIIVLGAIPQYGDAMVCGAGGAVPEFYLSAESVIVAKLVPVNKAGIDNLSRQYEMEPIQMLVEKVYKGKFVPGDTITLVPKSISRYQEGDLDIKYLLYLGKPLDNGQYGWRRCGRSARIDDANEDLLFLDKRDKVRGKTRISGRLKYWYGAPGDFSNRKIRIRQQDKVWEVLTNEYGVFEIYDLPSGEYLVEPEIPSGWKIHFYALRNIPSITPDSLIRQIPIELSYHISLAINFSIDNAIRGRVLTSTGEAMKGVWLEAEGIDRPYGGAHSLTMENGEFELQGMPAGDYIVVADNDITNKEQRGRIYYPGVFDKKLAKVFTMAPGVFINDLTMRMPNAAK